MASRSLNKVMLIGNLTRDPELRYTPQGTAVATVSMATNRSWTNADTGEKTEQVEFHRLVAWAKLAEICGQYLKKGKKIYVEGRLQTRDWTTKDGQKRQTTEIVMESMIMLDGSRGDDGAPTVLSKKEDSAPPADVDEAPAEPVKAEDISDDIPF